MTTALEKYPNCDAPCSFLIYVTSGASQQREVEVSQQMATSSTSTCQRPRSTSLDLTEVISLKFCTAPISSTGNPEHFMSRYEQSKDHRFRTRVGPDLHQVDMISTCTRYAGATHTEAMGSTILSTTMDPAMKMCRNTQKAVAGNRLDIPNTHRPTMFSQTNQIYCSLPKNTETMDRCPTINQTIQ